MINRIDASIDRLMIHHVGRATENEGVTYIDHEVDLSNPSIRDLLLSFFIDSFTSPEFYTFHNQRMQDGTLPMIPVVQQIFENPETLTEQSKAIAKLLYQNSDHPNIKSGDLLVSFISNLLVDDEVVDAIAIIKVENLQSFLQLNQDADRYHIRSLEGVSLDKIDKACLIFNTESEHGYKICAADKVSKGSEAKFWMEDFLCVEARTDDFYFTKNYIQATKQFIQDRMKPIYETDTADEAVIMNRSLNFLTHEEDFDAQEYERRIFKDEAVIADFQEYKQDYAAEQDVRLAEDFKISHAAIKNQSKVFRSVLKLDKNFHVYIHGNKDMIEKGVDEMGRKFYKLFYNEEN